MGFKDNKRISTIIKKPLVIAVIIVLVSVSIFSFYVITAPKDSYHTPKVSFHVSFSGNPSPAAMPALSGQNSNLAASPFYSYNMSNISVRVFALSPYLEISGPQSIISNSSSNSSYMELLRATHANSHGIINGTLSPEFHSIITEYSTIFSGSSGRYMIQSMDVDAQYQFAYQGKMYVYRYYNTLPFSPSSSIFINGLNTYTFHLDIGFNMNQHPVILNITNTSANTLHASPEGQIGPPGGNLNCNNHITTKTTTYWGPYIVNAAQITNGYGMIGSVYMSSYSSFGWMNTSGVQVMDQSNSGSIVGSNTAWGTGKNVSFNFSSDSVSALSYRISQNNPEYNISMAVLTNFEYGIIYQVIKVFEVNGQYCEYVGTYNQTTVKILNGNNDTLNMISGSPPILYGLPSNITNNVTLYNRYVNDTGYMMNTFFVHRVINKINVSAGGQTSIFNYELASGTFKNSSTNYIKALEDAINAAQDGGIKAFESGNYALGIAGLGMDIALIGLAAALPTGGVGLVVAGIGAILTGIGLALTAVQTATITYTFAWQSQSFSDLHIVNFVGNSDPGFSTYFYNTQPVTWEFPNGSSAEVNMVNPYINMIAN